MNNFILHTPTKVLFGKGQVAQLRGQIPSDARILVTYGGGSVVRSGLLDQIRSELAGLTLFEFGGIEPNPTYETLMGAVELARAEKVDFLLAVGGGSVLDGSKFIAAAAHYDPARDPWHILETVGGEVASAIPLGSVLTLPATGSEMNMGAVITRKSTGDKQHFFSPFVMPRFAVLDPVLTYTLPARQVANGVVDAFIHTLEQYLTYPVDAKVQDRFAEGLLLTLAEEGPKALVEPENYDVRANIMWSATLALNGLIGAGVPQDWATHMLGHEITALHGLDHAQTLAVVLPALLQAKREQKRAKLLQYADRVWDLRSGSDEARIDGAIAATRDFFERMGIKTRLRDYVADARIDALLAKLEEHGMTALGEHGDIDLAQSRHIYEAAW
ncbi:MULTISPECIES: alcohol dehydrogenase [Aeromonas]|jgi:NADP-dependent alcohol dehydrogenase|uniref:Alcohol dehydrogenase n=1 Tax=Aeromonas caviae TaxID=648 RepID=A0A3G9IW00_AERCA|nr:MULTISPECIES: alcohol dehydrogenase [Aeromonas]MDU7311918.1 alcohol dehydrogenase [Aeromonas sp.]AUV17154.1 NADH-dependent alcohol dehydrogenase [Aeromonas sp. ASNIH7]KMY39704.1 aldehyde reductase [Aeromonas caviae]MBL0536803.1 alcohol dehydrogenase [Aeromonas caviae]MBL0557206.1 alcohol dehydrogenase [Aeromonas caviae]